MTERKIKNNLVRVWPKNHELAHLRGKTGNVFYASPENIQRKDGVWIHPVWVYTEDGGERIIFEENELEIIKDPKFFETYNVIIVKAEQEYNVNRLGIVQHKIYHDEGLWSYMVWFRKTDVDELHHFWEHELDFARKSKYEMHEKLKIVNPVKCESHQHSENNSHLMNKIGAVIGILLSDDWEIYYILDVEGKEERVIEHEVITTGEFRPVEEYEDIPRRNLPIIKCEEEIAYTMKDDKKFIPRNDLKYVKKEEGKLIKIRNFHGPLEESVLEGFESKWNIKFPKEYRNFLLEYNGGIPYPASFSLIKKTTLIDSLISEIRNFMAISTNWQNSKLDYGSNMDWLYSVYRNRFDMPKHMLPIAIADLGVVCISINEKDYGKIYFWETESEQFQLISNSFKEFLESLYEYKITFTD